MDFSEIHAVQSFFSVLRAQAGKHLLDISPGEFLIAHETLNLELF